MIDQSSRMRRSSENRRGAYIRMRTPPSHPPTQVVPGGAKHLPGREGQ